MKHYLTALVLVGGLAAAQAHAGCDYPSKPGKFPDGNAASQDEMMAAKKLVVQYKTEMEGYMSCLDKELGEKLASMPNATDEEKAELQKKSDVKHDAAVTELQTVAEDFNVQLRAYNAKKAAQKPAS